MSNSSSPHSPYAILGEHGIKALTNTFYEVMDQRIEAAPIRAMHAQNMDEIKKKLYEYLVEWMGGPPLYSERYGSVCLTSAHKPYTIGKSERDQWLDCMSIAVDQIITDNPACGETLKDMLDQPMFKIADAVRNCE